MDQRDQLLGLIQQLYAAPGTTDGWRVFLDGLCTIVNGSCASFISHDLTSNRGSVLVSVRIHPDASLLYDQYWSALDPWAQSPKLPQIVRERSVAVGDELVPHAAFKRTPYYAGFPRRFSAVRMLGGAIEAGPAALSVISVNGSEHQEPFGKREIALLEPLVPHIRRALQLHRRLTRADAASEDFASVIDAARRGVLLIDGGGRISFMNRAASELTSMRDGLAVDHGELRASRVADTAHLRSVIASAIKTSNGAGIVTGGMFMLGRPSGRRPLVLLVSPVSRQQPLFPAVQLASAAVFVTDPDRVDVPDEDQLGALFGLTREEAKLACLLAQGSSLLEAGSRLGVRRETVRSRLKTIFEKTNTHRQPDLVRLVLNGIPRM